MKKKTTTKTAPKATARTTKGAAKAKKTRAKRSPAAKLIAPDFSAKKFAKAVEGTIPLKSKTTTTKRGPRPQKRSKLRSAAAKIGKLASKIRRAIGDKK